jgi:hypothetical protein
MKSWIVFILTTSFLSYVKEQLLNTAGHGNEQFEKAYDKPRDPVDDETRRRKVHQELTDRAPP